MENEPVLVTKDLTRTFLQRTVFGTVRTSVQALREFSFAFQKNLTYGIVGESGSGKTTLARLLVHLDQPSQGEIAYEGRRVDLFTSRQFKPLRRRIQMIFQNPAASLDPRWQVEEIVGEGLVNEKNRSRRRERIVKALNEVGLGSDILDRFPHQFSGGEKQRLAIARALVMEPQLLVLDEPLANLDVLVQRQILDLLIRLKSRYDLTMIFITHDLAVVRLFCDQVIVLEKGRLVETNATRELFERPQAAYTKKLLESIPT